MQVIIETGVDDAVAGSNYKNKRSDLLATVRSKMVVVLATVALGVVLGACGKGNSAPDQPQGGMALPVSVIEVQPVTVPVSAEAVAQTEGAKEVENKAARRRHSAQAPV